MADPRNQLRPALLDRISGEGPVTLPRLIETVRRDLGWLLNATCMGALQDLTAYPEVARSTMNFGIPDFVGKTASNLPIGKLALQIRQAIWDFEPRLLRDSVRVEPTDDAGSVENVVRFRIEADLWALPAPRRVLFETRLDLDAGSAQLELERG